MVQGAAVFTADDLLRLSDNLRRYELVRGELREMAPVNAGHGYRTVGLSARLYDFVEENDLGYVFTETGFILGQGPDTVRAPDIAFVRRDRFAEAALDDRGFLPMAPDLAVEVISPSETAEDLAEKVQEYLAAGVEQIWLVSNRTKTIQIYRQPAEAITLGVDDSLDGEDLLPGFSLPLGELFKVRPKPKK